MVRPLLHNNLVASAHRTTVRPSVHVRVEHVGDTTVREGELAVGEHVDLSKDDSCATILVQLG